MFSSHRGLMAIGKVPRRTATECAEPSLVLVGVGLSNSTVGQNPPHLNPLPRKAEDENDDEDEPEVPSCFCAGFK
jgi:hypothetical protein